MSEPWQDRKIKSGYERAGDLAKRYNRRNYRKHPALQRSIVESSLDKLGWLGSVKQGANNVIFDGHLRIELALAKFGPDALVPVDYYDLSPEETDQALLLHDTTTGMADIDFVMLDELWKETPTLEIPEFDAWLGEFLKDGLNGAGETRNITRSGRLYNAGEGHDIEPFKLAYRIEAAWRVKGNLALDLFSGQGQLAAWYKRRFKQVITVDKGYQVGDVDYSMSASDFINKELGNYLDFDFVDFDDEGTPASEIQELFRTIAGKKKNSFVLALTDGNGMNLKFRGIFDFGKYLAEGEGKRRATLEDYQHFEDLVTNFVTTCAKGAKFTPTMLSSYRGREGNMVYQTWLIETEART